MNGKQIGETCGFITADNWTEKQLMFENIGFGKFFLKLPPIIDEDGNRRPRIPHNSIVKVVTNDFMNIYSQ